MSGPEPGFYDDGTGSGTRRWWDGQKWTEHRESSPAPTVTTQAPPAPGPAKRRSPLLIGCLVLVLIALVLTVAGVIIAAIATGAQPTTAKSHAAAPAPAITGAALDNELAWGECQQLVIKKLKPTADAPITWSQQSQKGSPASMVAAGHAATGPLAYRYQCTFSFDAKNNITSESLDWVYPA